MTPGPSKPPRLKWWEMLIVYAFTAFLIYGFVILTIVAFPLVLFVIGLLYRGPFPPRNAPRWVNRGPFIG